MILFSSATLIEPQVFFNLYSHKLSWHRVVISSGASAINHMVSNVRNRSLFAQSSGGSIWIWLHELKCVSPKPKIWIFDIWWLITAQNSINPYHQQPMFLNQFKHTRNPEQRPLHTKAHFIVKQYTVVSNWVIKSWPGCRKQYTYSLLIVEYYSVKLLILRELNGIFELIQMSEDIYNCLHVADNLEFGFRNLELWFCKSFGFCMLPAILLASMGISDAIKLHQHWH